VDKEAIAPPATTSVGSVDNVEILPPPQTAVSARGGWQARDRYDVAVLIDACGLAQPAHRGAGHDPIEIRPPGTPWVHPSESVRTPLPRA
jgi:hypothetical protein